MKRVLQKLVFMFIGLAICNAGARPDLQEVARQRKTAITEEALFGKTLYPYMRKNCAECHSEQAIWPVGPSHSHSNSHNAFAVFTRLVDHNDPKSSRFIKFGSNKHFCKEHGYNCEKQDQVVAELSKLFDEYTKATKSAVAAPVNQNSWKIERGQTTNVQKVSLNGVEFQLETVVRMYKGDYIKVVSISLTNAGKVDVALDGIEIRVNGNFPMKATGIENYKRQLSFDGVTAMKTKLTLNREIILKAKPGDLLSVVLTNLRNEKIATNKECANTGRVDQIYTDLGVAVQSFSQSVFGSYDAFTKRSRAQVCNQVQLLINKDALSQSTFVQMLPKNQQDAYTKIIPTWFVSSSSKIIVLDPILMTSSTFGNTCYGTAKDVYCFGEVGERHEIFSAGVQRLVTGTRSFAVEDKNNIWSFFDNENDIPRSAKENKTYDFGFKVKDLQIGYQIACFLSPQNELFCGGGFDREEFNFPDANAFHKLSDIKFKEFHLHVHRIIAIGIDGKVYYFGREYNADRSNIALERFINKDNNQFIFSSTVKKVIDQFESFVIVSTDNKLHAYSKDSASDSASFIFGENFEQGREVSEGIIFSQITVLKTSMCGLNIANELLCRGTYIRGLKNKENGRTSSTFQKITNAPLNIKEIIKDGYDEVCFLLENNQITCAGDDQQSLGLRGSAQQNQDGRGRKLYTGENSAQKQESQFVAPHIIAPIL